MPPVPPGLHRVDELLSFARHLGAEDPVCLFQLQLPERAVEESERMIEKYNLRSGTVVALNLGASRLEVIWHITLKFLRPAIIGAGAVAFLMSFENFNTTLFLVGYEATLPINLYLQVRDGSTPVINAISFLLIVGTSLLALMNLYFSRKGESS